RLIAIGSDLSKEMEIDFAVAVPNETIGNAFAATIEKMGLETSVEVDDEDGTWTCYCMCIMVPDYDAIIRIQRTLEEIGRPLNAKPDGWGTFGNTETMES
ncbi:MAG TPA: ribonuclease E inhibitor RraB, partial [Urbifossiella sp.]